MSRLISIVFSHLLKKRKKRKEKNLGSNTLEFGFLLNIQF